MNIKQGLSIAVLALAVNSAFAAGSPGVERNTQGFLNALAAGGGKSLEQLSPKEARAVLVGAQAMVKVDVSGIKVVDKTIQVDSQSIQLKVVRPANAEGTLPVFLFFHGGGWVLAITRPTNA